MDQLLVAQESEVAKMAIPKVGGSREKHVGERREEQLRSPFGQRSG